MAAAVTALHFYALREVLPGQWSVPVDDTFIHLHYARSIAEGHPFSYHRGDGYSTGSTSPLYALLLAPLVGLGLDGERAVPLTLVLGGIWLALSLLLILRLGRQLHSPAGGQVAAALFGSWGFVWLCFYGGMETGLYVTLLLAAASTFISWSRQLDPQPRWYAVTAAALLPLVRPDGLFLLLVLLALVVGRALRRGSRRALWAWSLSLLPVGLYYLVNLGLTGTFSTAGMVSKSLLHAPYLSGAEKAARMGSHLLEAIRQFLAGGDPLYLEPWIAGPGLAALIALAARERARRSLGPYLLLLAWMFIALLAACMHNVRIAQWTRYYLPSFVLILLGTGLLVAWLAQALHRRWLAFGVAATLVLFQAEQTQRWVKLYQRDVSIIHGKQMAAARAVARLPASARVLVCDAGAIPYLSGRWTFDIVGLTTPLRWNYFRNGVGSRFELFERLPAQRRPTHLAAYQFCLWPGASGRPLSLHHDLLVAPLAETGAGSGERPATPLPATAKLIDRVDVADLDSEAAHGYRLDRPGGMVDNLLRRGRLGQAAALISDGGRRVLGSERFRLKARAGAAARLVVRSHQEGPVKLSLRLGPARRTLQLAATAADQFTESVIELPASAISDDNEVLVEPAGSYASYHYFLLQEPR